MTVGIILTVFGVVCMVPGLCLILKAVWDMLADAIRREEWDELILALFWVGAVLCLSGLAVYQIMKQKQG